MRSNLDWDRIADSYVLLYAHLQFSVVFFRNKFRMEGQEIKPEGAVSANYNGIKWTPFRSQLLEDFYNMSPIDMQCNRSDGSRFPGTWSSMPVPAFLPLSPPMNPTDECFLGELDETEVVSTQ